MALKAKLADKGRLRPHEMIRKKMPDGTGSLQDLPMRAHGAAAEDEAADGEYCKAIDRVTAVFGKQNRAQTTADEHKMYARMLDSWLVREGFGSYFEADLEHGRCIAVRARRGQSGEKKVIKPQMLIGYLLQMATGGESTPKGGHAKDLAARAATEVATACGQRSKMKRSKGKFGYGPYKDESWSLQAFQKRVYAVRDVYATELKDTRVENPGWDDAVCGVLSSLAKLVGKKAQHVPQVRART